MDTGHNHHRRFRDDASVRTIDMPDVAQLLRDNNGSHVRDSMPDTLHKAQDASGMKSGDAIHIAQLLRDDDGSHLRDSTPNALHKVQNAPGMKSGDAIPSNVSVGLLSYDNNKGHRQQQQRRNSLDSTMSDVSFDESFGHFEDRDCETFFHNKADPINVSAFGPGEYTTYDGRHVKAESNIPINATDMNNSHHNNWFHHLGRSPLDSRISIVSIPEDGSSLCTIGSNECDTVHQDAYARANMNRVKPAKPHSYSSQEFMKEMRLLTSFMNASARSRRSVCDIENEMHRYSLHTSATAGTFSHPFQAFTGTEAKAKDEKRHSDFVNQSRHNKNIPRTPVKKRSPRKYKRRPNNSPLTV